MFGGANPARGLIIAIDQSEYQERNSFTVRTMTVRLSRRTVKVNSWKNLKYEQNIKGQNQSNDSALDVFGIRKGYYAFLFLRPIPARPTRPVPNNSMVAGSGTSGLNTIEVPIVKLDCVVCRSAKKRSNL